DKKGEYFQIGLATGSYKITAEKEKLASQPVNANVSAGKTFEHNLVMGVPSAAANAEGAKRIADLKRVFDEGVALSNSGKHNEAIERFNAGIAVQPTCSDCYNNIGFSHAQLKEWDKAEAAYKKAIELKADDAGAYNGLATVYNAQRKFD